jgi:hypothetical protein
MSQVSSFRDLEVWRLSVDLVESCYRLVRSFPPSDRFIFNHLSIAQGSQAELETHIEIVRRLGLSGVGQVSAIDELARTVGRLLNGLKASMERVSLDSTDP